VPRPSDWRSGTSEGSGNASELPQADEGLASLADWARTKARTTALPRRICGHGVRSVPPARGHVVLQSERVPLAPT